MRFLVFLLLIMSILIIPNAYSQDCSVIGHCGDGVCDSGDNCNNCPQDCGSCCECSGGQVQYDGGCGQCGTLRRDCNGCNWGGWYCTGEQANYGQGCGNCGTINCAGSCVNQGPCSPGSTQCSGSRYQSCSSGCQWQNSGTDADNDGTDSQCGDSLCDNNPTFVNANRQCDAGQTQCSNGKYQTCNNCAWQNSGTNADNDAKDSQCGDSICDNSPNVYDDTRTPSENACTDSLDNDCDLKTDCGDNDCDGSITGSVKNTENASVPGTDVSAKKDLTIVKSSTTNSQGTYTISSIACGSYNLVASHPDYAPQAKSNVPVNPQQPTTSNFGGPGDSNPLVLGTSCEPDCTFAGDSIIHASCDGKNGCSFYDNAAKSVCDNAQPGWFRDYNSTHFITCASGSPQPNIEIKASVSCASGTLVKVTRIVVYNGKPVKLVVAACG